MSDAARPVPPVLAVAGVDEGLPAARRRPARGAHRASTSRSGADDAGRHPRRLGRRQEHAAARPRRPSTARTPASVWIDGPATLYAFGAGELGALPGSRTPRLRLPVPPPAARVHRARERDDAGRLARRREAEVRERAPRRSAGSASPSRCDAPAGASSRAARRSGWRWRGPWSTGPELVLADEPSGNLDRENADRLHALLVDAGAETATTVVVATHNDRLAALADSVLTLDAGRTSRRGQAGRIRTLSAEGGPNADALPDLRQEPGHGALHGDPGQPDDRRSTSASACAEEKGLAAVPATPKNFSDRRPAGQDGGRHDHHRGGARRARAVPALRHALLGLQGDRPARLRRLLHRVPVPAAPAAAPHPRRHAPPRQAPRRATARRVAAHAPDAAPARRAAARGRARGLRARRRAARPDPRTRGRDARRTAARGTAHGRARPDTRAARRASRRAARAAGPVARRQRPAARTSCSRPASGWPATCAGVPFTHRAREEQLRGVLQRVERGRGGARRRSPAACCLRMHELGAARAPVPGRAPPGQPRAVATAPRPRGLFVVARRAPLAHDQRGGPPAAAGAGARASSWPRPWSAGRRRPTTTSTARSTTPSREELGLPDRLPDQRRHRAARLGAHPPAGAGAHQADRARCSRASRRSASRCAASTARAPRSWATSSRSRTRPRSAAASRRLVESLERVTRQILELEERARERLLRDARRPDRGQGLARLRHACATAGPWPPQEVINLCSAVRLGVALGLRRAAARCRARTSCWS